MDTERLQQVLNLRDSGQLSNALRQLEQMISEVDHPTERALLQLNRVPCLIRLGRIQQARIELDGIAKENVTYVVENPSFRYIEAALAQCEGRKDEALAQLNKILSDSAADLQTPELRYLYEMIQLRRGLLLVEMGRYRDSAPVLEESLSFGLPDDDKRLLFSNLGFCRQKLGDWESALEYYTTVVQLGIPSGWEGTVNYNLGIVYYRVGRFAEAKEQFTRCQVRATEYGYPASNLYKWLSFTCERLGERAQAEEYARLANPS